MAKDKLLFTPGPLTTSRTVKEAMLRDVGSRDEEFIAMVREIRRQLLELGGTSQEGGYEAVLVQGSGTFGVESVISSAIPAKGKLLALVNGAYGERIVQIAMRYGISTEVLRWSEDESVEAEAVKIALEADAAITHVMIVDCETTTGILNPTEKVGAIVRAADRTFIVDAMSSFGAVPTDLPEGNIDFLISSANKCIEGVPGFSFVLARRKKLESCKGQARTLSLDLYEQWRGLEGNGQFRFTPPTHTLLAFAQALKELAAEGGVAGRAARYLKNHNALKSGMKKLGFVPFLAPEVQSYIITAFHYPADKKFIFEDFYRKLSQRDMVIYPGKLGHVDCFRMGNIGRLQDKDIQELLVAVEAVLKEMKVALPVAKPK
ncbi:MAG TPA: 2-aminoethylphosphonate--pyruvate transaminase [Verrucomicrobiae bacterium]